MHLPRSTLAAPRAARWLTTAALAAASFAAFAQPFSTPPPPAAPRPLAIAAPTEARLPNGLRVIVARREGVPLVSAELVVLSGSEADPPQLAGLASMSASLLTQGTRRRSAPELAAAAEALGGSLDSSAGWNQSVVAITVTTPKLDAALGLVAEVATAPVFAAEEIDRVRQQSLDGLKVAYANPGTLASLLAARMTYGAGAYGHPAGGTPHSLPRIRQADLVGLHRQTFRPDNAVLVLAGDIGAEAGLALARRHFGTWRAPADALPREPVGAEPGTGPAAALIEMPQSGQAGVVLALAVPELKAGEHAVGSVMNSVLGSGYSSRLNQEIRIKRGLSYGAGSRLDARRGSGLFRISVQTKNESAAEVVGLVQAEIDRLMAAPVPDAELASRKTTLIGGVSRSVETTAGLADAIRELVVTGRSPAELPSLIGSLQAVSAADVQGYAAAHLGAAKRRIAIAGDASAANDALRAALPELVRVPLPALDFDNPAGFSKR